MAEGYTNLPPCKVLLRSKDGVEIYALHGERPEDLKKSNSRPFLCKGATSIPIVSAPDGTHIYIHLTGKGIVKCPIPSDVSSITEPMMFSEPFFADTKTVQMMDLSPQGSYLLTWQRWYEEKPNNLKVWETATGRLLAAFPQRNIKRDVWPYLQWTYDESAAVLLATSEVRIYPAANLLATNNEDPTSVRYDGKLRIQNIASFSIPRSSDPNVPFLLTSFVPGTKDKPARAGLYKFLPGGNTEPDTKPLLSKSLFQAEDMKVHWSPAGDAALLTLQTAVDTSGQSYYGSSQLFMLRHGESDVVAVPLPQEGPVLDVAWLPDAAKPPCFVVVAGKMPSLASLHHGKSGKASFVFGNAHRNVVSWSPHGRFLCLAGFGNLAGGMSFWDRNKQKLVNNGCMENASGSLRAESAVVGHDWSPSSRWFLCSTCSPRMNVDNGVRLFRYNGQAVSTLPWNNENYLPDRLLQACFLPATPTVYPDRAQSPPPEGFSESTATSTTPIAAAAAPKPAGRYVPPSARNRTGGGGLSLAERMRREKEGSMQSAARVVDNKVKTPQGSRGVVGMTQTAQKSKSALKREKEKKKKQQQQQQQEEEERQQAAAAAAASTADPEKRARKIKKTLKQIEDLKQKDASALNDDQKAKMASESDLRAELEKLGL
mmetsp:Transcript_13989/g.38677  ORF Transcript_13989/g.38677 Transcript_13989/m.38677 type:complete len:656 (+) Transcript_13989:64-2031(+)